MTQRTNHQIISKHVLWVWIVVTAVAATQFRYSEQRLKSTITYDKFGYYLYLPAFFYDDPAKLNHYQYLLDTYQPGGSYQALRAPNGNYVMKYTCGMAIMYLPAFAAGHFVAKILHYPVDGLSLPYQVAMNIYGLLIAIAGLYLLFACGWCPHQPHKAILYLG